MWCRWSRQSRRCWQKLLWMSSIPRPQRCTLSVAWDSSACGFHACWQPAETCGLQEEDGEEEVVAAAAVARRKEDQAVLRTSPLVCRQAVEAREAAELATRLQYSDAEFVIELVTKNTLQDAPSEPTICPALLWADCQASDAARSAVRLQASASQSAAAAGAPPSGWGVTRRWRGCAWWWPRSWACTR